MIAYHIIFGAYGFWLPNDPRGSWSAFVGSWELFRHGPATKTSTRRSLAGKSHNREQRVAGKLALKRPPVEFTAPQIDAVAAGFGAYVNKTGLDVYACAVLTDHIHLVVARQRLDPHKLVIQLKGAATNELTKRDIHPFDGAAKVFARGEWVVFLDTADDVRRAVSYVEANPEKEGLPRQNWGFLRGFEG